MRGVSEGSLGTVVAVSVTSGETNLNDTKAILQPQSHRGAEPTVGMSPGKIQGPIHVYVYCVGTDPGNPRCSG